MKRSAVYTFAFCLLVIAALVPSQVQAQNCFGGQAGVPQAYAGNGNGNGNGFGGGYYDRADPLLYSAPAQGYSNGWGIDCPNGSSTVFNNYNGYPFGQFRPSVGEYQFLPQLPQPVVFTLPVPQSQFDLRIQIELERRRRLFHRGQPGIQIQSSQFNGYGGGGYSRGR